MNVFDAVKDFHIKYKQAIGVRPTDEMLEFRLNLINEEVEELMDEFFQQDDSEGFNIILDEVPIEDIDWQNVTKELSDIIYVVVGMAVTFGLPLEEVFRRVQASNMTKDGGKREDGKVLKGENYEPPVLRDLFES